MTDEEKKERMMIENISLEDALIGVALPTGTETIIRSNGQGSLEDING